MQNDVNLTPEQIDGLVKKTAVFGVIGNGCFGSTSCLKESIDKSDGADIVKSEPDFSPTSIDNKPIRVFNDTEIVRLKQFGINVPREVWTQNELDIINKKCNTMLKVVTGRHSKRFQDKLRRKNLK